MGPEQRALAEIGLKSLDQRLDRLAHRGRVTRFVGLPPGLFIVQNEFAIKGDRVFGHSRELAHRTPPPAEDTLHAMSTKDSAKKTKKTKPAQAPQAIWMDQPEPHDYPAAGKYLTLVLPEAQVRMAVRALRNAPITTQKAKDILRASGLALLSAENPHVASDLAKIAGGKRLSPVLLVRGDARSARPLQVADGYHRVCASYHLDENTDIPVKLADLPAD